jgi:hypothetical protein
MEIWKDVPNYEGLYQVSDLGNVKSVYFWRGSLFRVLSPTIQKGYLYVKLSKNGIRKKYAIHQLVAMAFLDHKPNGNTIEVDHINFKRDDNRLCNLRLLKQRDNANKKHLKSSSQYIGVSYLKKRNKWRSRITINGKEVFLGEYKTEIEASNAYDAKLKEINE